MQHGLAHHIIGTQIIRSILSSFRLYSMIKIFCPKYILSFVIMVEDLESEISFLHHNTWFVI